MKKILIIADGILAKHFLQRVMENVSSENSYDVITYKNKTIPEKKPENFTFYDFDPTSFEKLYPVLANDYYQIMILVSKKIDAIGTYKNIRTLNKEVQIIMLDRWSLNLDDKRLQSLDSKSILSSRFADYLPDIPVIAQNVGLGIGEIMEIRVPVGSSFVYRHIASIAQRKWKIAGVYRGNKLLLPLPTLMIHPNDILLAIGEPNVLNSVYRSIKKELGQFPSPFGRSIYCLIDMKNKNNQKVNKVINDALLLHSKINSKKLYIKVINPTNFKILEKLKSYSNKYIDVEIDYFNKKSNFVMQGDLERYDIGLIIVTNEYFMKNIHNLYDTKLPIFKIGLWGFSNLTEGVVLSSNAEDIEKESSVIFDISSQLDLSIKLYNFNPSVANSSSGVVEHFENLSKILNKNIEIINNKRNPLLKLRNRNDILQFVPFNENILNSSILSIFSTNMEKLYFQLSNSYQLFIPTLA